MERAREDFEARVKEVDAFFKILKRMESPEAVIVSTTARGRRESPINSDGFTMLKATAFLVIYNMIEGAVRSSFGALYDKIRSENRTLEELSPELKIVWGRQQWRGSGSDSPHNAIQTIIENILEHSVVNFEAEYLRLPGNVDARRIRDVYEEHGIALKTPKTAYDGARLRVVKSKRNELAHGDVSFLECGREFSVEQLERIKHEAVLYVRGILRSMEKHIKRGAYAVGS